MEKRNISLPESTKKKEGGSSFQDKEIFHALVSRNIGYPSFIIDYGASRHMVSSREAFSYLDNSNGSNILLGENSETESKGKGNIDFDHGSFNDALYVPGLVAHLLLVYQMTHTRSPKKVVFTPNDVEIFEILNHRVIAKGFMDHS